MPLRAKSHFAQVFGWGPMSACSTSDPFPTFCVALGVDLNGLSTSKVLELCDIHIETHTRRHVCAHDLKTIGSDTISLSRCARCKGVYYSSPDAQKNNWSAHKGSCKIPAPRTVAGMSLQSTWNNIREQISRGAIDENFSLLLRHIRSRLEAADKSMTKTLELEMHTVSRNLVFMEDSPRIKLFHEMMWSAPGTADYFLFDEDLIAKDVRRHRLVFPYGLPSSDAQAHVLQNSSLQAVAADFSTEEANKLRIPGFGAVYKYCYLYFNLLLACAVVGKPSRRSANDGIGKLRSGSCAEAASKRVLQLWLDERTRISCGDAINPAFSFAVTYITERKGRAAPGELAPNCPIDEVLRACLMEILENGGGAKHATKLVKMIGEAANCIAVNPWDALDTTRRASIAILLAESIACSEGVLREGNKQEESLNVWDLELDKVLEFICGVDPEKRLEIWRIAATGSHLCAPGRLDSGRAFFHHLLMQWDVPKLIPSDKCTDADKRNLEEEQKGVYAKMLLQPMAEQALEFSASPWPVALTARERGGYGGRPYTPEFEAAANKLECYSLAMDTGRFNLFNRMFNVPHLLNCENNPSPLHNNIFGGNNEKQAGTQTAFKKRVNTSTYDGADTLSDDELKAKIDQADRIAMSLWEEEEEKDRKMAKKGKKGAGKK